MNARSAALLALVLAACARQATAPTPGPAPPTVISPTTLPAADAATAQDAAPASVTDAGPKSDTPRQGVNLSGAEFGKVLGRHGTDYTWSQTNAAGDYFAARGFNHFRVPFRHERLQPVLQGPLDEVEWARLKGVVDHLTALGATVMLEAQNGYRHGVNGCVSSAPADPHCTIVTAVQIGDFWGRVATRLRDNPLVQINPTNEPHDIPTELVATLGEAALREVRRVGFGGLVALPGGGWAGAGHWAEAFDGTTPSAKAMLAVQDPGGGPVAYEVHLYLDPAATGDGVSDCVSPDIGALRLAPFLDWLRTNGKRGVVGEIAAINTPKCRVALTNALAVITASGLIDSWSWWGAGAWAFATTYALSIGPTPPGQPEKAQLAWLKPFLP